MPIILCHTILPARECTGLRRAIPTTTGGTVEVTSATVTIEWEYLYYPNAGNLYYSGGSFATSKMMWWNPSWTREDNCLFDPLNCSTYEHDLKLDREWFTNLAGVSPGRYCMSWSNLPDPYDDCPTSGINDPEGNVILSFGSYEAYLIAPRLEYSGGWIFKNQQAAPVKAGVELLGQEGYFGVNLGNIALCPIKRKSIWCVNGVGGHQRALMETEWERGTSKDETYYNP